MLQFKVGDKVCWSDINNTTHIEEGTVSKVGKDYCELNENKEMLLYTAFLFPIRVKEEYQQILNERARLKKAYDDSMSLVYQLINAIARGEK